MKPERAISGLTAIPASQVTELLSSDFPEKHEAYRMACMARMKEEQFMRQREMLLVREVS